MTYQMTRVRMRSIGHPDSRYRDLTIPLCDPQGRPVDSLLWLANGGGKTSLLSLLFALVLPLRRDFMGAEDQERALEEYVQKGDTSHVVIEWVDLDAGGLPGLDSTLPRLVTGMVHEWSGRVAPADRAADKNKLGSLYYAFTGVPGALTLDTLPIVDDDNTPRTLRDFTEALKESSRQSGGAHDLELFQGKRVAWAEYLEENLGIDPGLYRYQVKMNAAEGAVAKLFRFRSSREFIEFLIEFTAGQGGSSARSLDTTTDNVRTLLAKLASRPRLAIEQRFAAAAAERLTALHEAGAAHAAAVSRRRSSQEQSATVSASLVAAAETLTKDAARTRENDASVAQRLKRAAADRQVAHDRAAQYDLEDARLAAGEAAAAHRTAAASAAAARRLDSAWRAVPTLADVAALDGEITTLRTQVNAETESALPLRRRHDEAAAALRVSLEAAAVSADARASELASDAARRQAALADVVGAETTALRAAAKAEEAAAQRREQARVATRKAAAETGGSDVRAWRADGIAASRVRVSAAAGEADDDEARQRAELTGLEREATAAGERLAELAEQLEKLNAELRVTDRAARAAADAHRAASGALSALAAESRVRDVAEAAEDDPLDLHSLGEVLHTRLAEAAQSALAEYAEHTAAAGAHEAVLAAVSATGYAPAAGDTVEAVRSLHAAGVDARPGWEVLRELAPDRAALARALQADDVAVLAAGVVVPPGDVERVRELLGRAELTTPGVVAVADRPAVAAALARDDPGAGRLVPLRLPADPALYDGDAAGDARARHEKHAQDAREAAGAARAAAEADRALAGRLRVVLDEYPAHEMHRLETEQTRTATEQRRAQESLDAATAERRTLSARVAELAPLTRAGEKRARAASLAAAALRRASSLLADAAALEESAAAADEEAAEAHETAERRASDAAALRAEVAQLETRHREALTGVRSLREEHARVLLVAPDEPAADAAPAAPASGGLDQLRAAYEGLRREWESQTSASQAARLLEDAERRRQKLRERLPDDTALAAAAAELLAGPDGATSAAQSAAAERAHEAALTAERDLAAAEGELRRAEKLVAERRPRDKESHASLPAKPATRHEAGRGAAESRERVAVLERSVAGLGEEHDALTARVARVTAAAEWLRHKARELDAGRLAADGELVQAPVDDTLVANYLGIDDGGRAHEELSVSRGRECADVDVAEALAQERSLGDAVTTAAAQVTAATTALRRLGATAEFKDVPDTIRERVLADDTATLLGTAETLARDLRQRADLIGHQLDALAVDTDLVVSRLVTAVRDVMSDLMKAERYARMPAGTGTWSDRSFLTIRTGTPPEPSVISDRLRPVLERFAANPDALVPMALLKECVLAGAGGPQAFRVKVLKPNAPGQEPEDITHLQKFSGGEKLTVCVALYCVLAKLRAHNAGQDGGGGTLVLDNPLGTASHTRLLSLQRKVAAAHGVQLVYATGVNDLGAVGEFSHRIRLRKTWHAAVGRSYVDRLPESPEITAAHVGQKEGVAG